MNPRMLEPMSAKRIGRRSQLSQPDMTLDVAMYLGLVLLAAVLLMWKMPPRPLPSLFADAHSASQR
jgi:hypothetical protein